MPRPPRATLEELQEFANKVREAGGGNPIDALMPAVPQDPTQCLIAKNLNFNCSVTGADHAAWPSDRWVMELDREDIRDRIAEALDLPKSNRSMRYAVLLPEKIGQVAADFDEAGDIVAYLHSEFDYALWGECEVDAKDYDPSDPAQKAVFNRSVEETLNTYSEEERALVREMLPMIEQARKEAYDLATIITPEGKIVL